MPHDHEFSLRRVYDDRHPGEGGGYRVLVDRLWPRGISKAEAALDEWLKDVAPSTDLRRWYGHDVARFKEFVRRYRAELRGLPAAVAVDHLLDLGGTEAITLLTATADVEHSGAKVLLDHLTRRASHAPRQGPKRRHAASARRGAAGPADR
jgi:uncharacterized protein YeaO (DUF488 family)